MSATATTYDDTYPRAERWKVLREQTPNRWITVESFPTEREAKAFAQGFTLGTAYATPPEPLEAREGSALAMVKLARDDYKRQCRELRAQLAEVVS